MTDSTYPEAGGAHEDKIMPALLSHDSLTSQQALCAQRPECAGDEGGPREPGPTPPGATRPLGGAGPGSGRKEGPGKGGAGMGAHMGRTARARPLGPE